MFAVTRPVRRKCAKIVMVTSGVVRSAVLLGVASVKIISRLATNAVVRNVMIVHLSMCLVTRPVRRKCVNFVMTISGIVRSAVLLGVACVKLSYFVLDVNRRSVLIV